MSTKPTRSTKTTRTAKAKKPIGAARPAKNARASATPSLSREQLEAHWMPYTGNRQFKRDPRLIDAADGVHLIDDKGRRILDGLSGLWCCGLGHGRQDFPGPGFVFPVDQQAHPVDRLEHGVGAAGVVSQHHGLDALGGQQPRGHLRPDRLGGFRGDVPAGAVRRALRRGRRGQKQRQRKKKATQE